MKHLLFGLLGLAALAVFALIAAIILGGPRRIVMTANLDSQPAQFASSALETELSVLPDLQQYQARDGASLGYRIYASMAPAGGQSAVLVPGSSQSSGHVHALAAALSRAGLTVYTLDVRGHGSSGRRGHIAYLGQLEDDLDDFVRFVKPARPCTLIGFSASGGFALRFAGSERQRLFDRYLLLAPTMSPLISPSVYKYNGSENAGWVSIGLPRLIALTLLNRLGITFLNDLDAAYFRLSDEAKKTHTATYSYALYCNFGPLNDYQANILAARQPMLLIAGQDDELIHSDRYAAIFKDAGHPIPVILVPGVGHLSLMEARSSFEVIVGRLLGDPFSPKDRN